MARQMGSGWKSGTLTSSATTTIQMAGAPLPCTVTLKSAAASRKIQHSTDGGAELITPDVDVTSPTMLVTRFDLTVAIVVLTGAAGDTWDIR